MACQNVGCGACLFESHEDGILRGRSNTIEDKYNKPISVIFQELVKCGKISGKKNALEFCDSALTFDQLEDFSTSLALIIRDRLETDIKIKNPDGDPIIAIMNPNSAKSIVLIMAILKTGAAYLPLDEEYPEALLLKITGKFRPVLIIADDNGPMFNKHDPSKFSQFCNIVTLEELWISIEIPTHDRKSIKPEILDVFSKVDPSSNATPLPAVVMHTRGFHDNPNGVRIGHAAIINRCIFEWNQFHLKENQSCSLTTQLSQVNSVSQIFSALLKGCTLVIFGHADFKDVSQFVRDVSTRMINRLVISYYLLHEVLKTIDKSDRKEMGNSLKCLKYVVCHGGFIRHEDANLYFQIFQDVPLCNCTGSAETSGDMIYDIFYSANDFAKKKAFGKPSLGKVMQNTKIYILGEELAIISDGHQGELCISGACLAINYVDPGNVQDQKHTFVKNLQHDDSSGGFKMIYRSGEFGRIVKGRDGRRRLYVEGRDDRIIKQKGHEFHVDDVVPFLTELPFAKEAFLYIINKGKPSQEMVGFILVTPGISPSAVPTTLEIERSLRNKLPDWAIPDEFMLIRGVPKHYYNDRCQCCLVHEYREQREPKSNAWEGHLVVTPDKWEAAVTLVKAIFKMAFIPAETIVANLKSSFYDLGGTSSNTLPLLVYLNKQGYPVTLKDFYSKPNLMDFISLMAIKKPSTIQELTESKRLVNVQDEASSDNFGIGQWVKPNFHIMLDFTESYSVEIIRKRHKNAVIRLIATGYCENGDMSGYNMINYNEMESFLMEAWNSIFDEQLTICIIQKSNNKVVGVAVCQDFFKLIDTTKANGTLFNIMEFYQEVKGNILLFLPHRMGETLEIAWMAVISGLHPVENVKIITTLHAEIIKLAKQSYSGIFHSTANLLSRTLCTEVYGYEIFEDFQINKYQEVDMSRPFHLAPDQAACAALYLKLRDPIPPSEATSLTVIDPVVYFNNMNRKRISGVKYYHSKEYGL